MNGKKSMMDIIKETQRNMYDRLNSDPFFEDFQKYRKRAILSKKLGNPEESKEYMDLAEQKRKQLMPQLLEELLQYTR